MNIENKDFCTQCDKHCPVNALQCGKGRRLFGLESSEQGEYTCHSKEHAHGEHGSHGKEHDREEHRCCGKQHGHGDHGRCGKEHEHHHDKPWWEGRDDLSALLGKCGHHLFKHPGKGRGQAQILRILSEKKSISQRQLQQILDIKPGSISEILTKLESKGYILREKSEEDKRAAIVSITEAGEAALAEKDAKAEQRDLFACLTQEEKDVLQATLTKLLSSWDRNEGSETVK